MSRLALEFKKKYRVGTPKAEEIEIVLVLESPLLPKENNAFIYELGSLIGPFGAPIHFPDPFPHY